MRVAAADETETGKERECADVRTALRASFDTTQWSVILTARDNDSVAGAAALEKLCRRYWGPLYAYVRRKGYAPADAQDLTQEFFARLVAKSYLQSVDATAGSFRSFLLASLNHLLLNEWDKARTLKRGGGYEFVSLDAEQAEGHLLGEASSKESPEKAFDRSWVTTLLEHALAELRREASKAGKLQRFELLKGFLSDVADEGEYARLAEPLGCDAGGVAVAVHRLRQHYRELVRLEVAQTVTSEAELESEMRCLFEAFD